MYDIRIRVCQEADIETCVAIALKAEEIYQNSHRELLSDEIYAAAMRGWQEETADGVRKQLTEQPAMVAVCGDTVVGFAAYKYSGHIGRISRNAVDPEMDQRAVAGKLFDSVLEMLRQNGVTHVMANCGADPVYDTARKAFADAGFEIYLPHVKYFQKLGQPPALPETDLQIVPCKEEHIADCVRIALQVWEGIHNAYAKLQGEAMHEAVSGGWREAKAAEIAAQQSEDAGIVALLDGKVVGFCGYRFVNDALGNIGFNGVDPAYRGRGIARYLYEYAFAQMRKAGAGYARVFTGGDDGHAPARRAYEKAGFDKRLLTLTYYKAI